MEGNRQGFTLVEIMIVIAIIGLLVVISYPSYQKAREQARKTTCQNNLRVIATEAEMYFFENSDVESLSPSDFADQFKDGEVPICPSGGTYTIDVDRDPYAYCDYGFGHAL